ncbi:MAG: hypothetical protein ACREL6_06310, partial [Gemmatimonadales bacterium]
MGVYAFIILGMAPFGSLQAGWIAEWLGVSRAFGIGGAICLVTAIALTIRMRGNLKRASGRESRGLPAIRIDRLP